MLVVGFERIPGFGPLRGSFPVVVHSLMVIVVASGGGTGGFLGTFCRSSGLGMIVRYLGFP